MKRKSLTLLIILVLIALFIVFLPTLASTPMGKSPLLKMIAKKNNAKVEAGAFHLTWFGPQKIQNFQYSDVNVDLGFDELTSSLPLWSFLSSINKDKTQLITKGNLLVRNGHIILHLPNYPEIVFSEVNAKSSKSYVSLNSRLLTPTTGETGEITLDGTIENWQTNLKNAEVDVKGNIVNLPLFALDFFIPPKKEIKDLLGDEITLSFQTRIQNGEGSFKGTLHSTNIQTTLDAKLQNQIITLQQPLKIIFHLTKKLSEALLSDVSPFFLTGIEAKNPIFLNIDSTGFQLPLPFSPQTLAISKATLDMGKIRCQNGGSLSLAVSLFKLNNLTSTKTMEVWFTPVDFSVQNGQLSAGRMDFLMADNIHLATWGKINLINNQLDMILGIPNDTLQTSFNIQNLPKNYVMQLSIRGTRSKPKINLTEAAARITALAAAQNIPFGGVLTAIQKWHEPSAPSAKRPFPWER